MVKKHALIFFVLLAAGLSPARAAESKPAYSWVSAPGPVSGADGGLREIIVVSKTHFDIGFTGDGRGDVVEILNVRSSISWEVVFAATGERRE
ncbi:MAG: hypothetical protein KKH28_05245 [Elusimicrobia bacterium]|nr:hypothetical protein [Elusimicrobiota bacterium]